MGMGRKEYKEAMYLAKQRFRAALHLEPMDTINTAVVLGTGWAEAFPFQAQHSVSMVDLHGPFEAVEDLEGHARSYEIGTVTGKRLIVLRGRVHMNEFTFNPSGKLAVRAQIELLIGLGVKTLIL